MTRPRGRLQWFLMPLLPISRMHVLGAILMIVSMEEILRGIMVMDMCIKIINHLLCKKCEKGCVEMCVLGRGIT